ncbi:MAG: lytic murein transglycosylase [Acidobacteriota bacterium]
MEESEGPTYRLGFNNFYVLTRYNRSRLYASAVWELAQAIRKTPESP